MVSDCVQWFIMFSSLSNIWRSAFDCSATVCYGAEQEGSPRPCSGNESNLALFYFLKPKYIFNVSMNYKLFCRNYLLMVSGFLQLGQPIVCSSLSTKGCVSGGLSLTVSAISINCRFFLHWVAPLPLLTISGSSFVRLDPLVFVFQFVLTISL